MGTGYFQLTVTSEHDKYLVGNPQFTYFKGVYRQHTNFAIENRIINFTGDTFMGTNSNFGKKMYTNIPKNGDLLHRMYIVFNIEDITQNPGTGQTDASLQKIRDSISISGFSLIDYVEIKIGDQTIDRHTGEWMHMYHELFLKEGKNYSLCDMINTHSNCKGTDKYNIHKDGNIYIPLQFWFNKNPGLSLPLVALQNMDVRFELKLNTRSTIENTGTVTNTLKINRVNLLVEYIHLGNDEKLLFSSNPHEYLIEQVQSNIRNCIPLKKEMSDEDYEKYQHKFELPFNHPVKEIFWAIQDSNAECNTSGDLYNNGTVLTTGSGSVAITRGNRGNHLFNYWRNLDWKNKAHQLVDATIVLNGNQIFEPISANYFMTVLRHQYHSGYGYNNLSYKHLTPNKADNISYENGSGIYMYSFSLNPEEFQPSGSLNMSKIDKIELRVRVKRDTYINTSKPYVAGQAHSGYLVKEKQIKMYATNYNILRIMSGNAGLLFQN